MKKSIIICLCLCFSFGMFFGQTSEQERVTSSFGKDLVMGLEAYKLGNWEDTLFFLKRTNEYQNATSDVVWYFVVMSQINIGDYESVYKNGQIFIKEFPDSKYASEILYNTLFSSYKLTMYEQTISGFTNFVQKYPLSVHVPSALYYTAESLYSVYEFEQARALYNQILLDYPTSEYYSDAQYRIELLDHREREEKLLYLLRVTGEETLAAKEGYEKQIKELQSEESVMLRQRILELESLVTQLEVEKQDLENKNKNLQTDIRNLQNSNDSYIGEESTLLDELVNKATELQLILDKANED